MIDTRTVKLFKNGASQAVRLPVDFRFEGDEIFATRDDQTGDVVLSSHPSANGWGDFFALIGNIEDHENFMSERPMNLPSHDKDIFGDA